MEKIFVIAWDFPPSSNGESIVCSKTLNASQYEYDIIRHSDPLDYVTTSYSEKHNVYTIGGGYLEWSIAVIKKFIELDRINHYRVVNSRTMPPMGHFVGLLIKLIRPNIKWIAYFSDPLWNSPYILEMFSKRTWKEHLTSIRKDPFTKAFYFGSIFGKFAIRFSDILMFNNHYLADYVVGNKSNRYKDKIHIVPYGFDEARLGSIKASDKDEKHIVFTHTGHVYGSRSFQIIVDALLMLRETNQEIYDLIQICQVGWVEPLEMKYIENKNMLEKFTFIGVVDYDTSIAYMKAANYLITIDAKFENIDHNIYIPSKIYDYLGTYKPIIGITQSKGPTADILINTNNYIIEHDSKALYNLFIDIAHNRGKTPDYELYKSYTSEVGAACFDKLIDSVVTNITY